MTHARAFPTPRPAVVRRNAPQRLAGLGYAAITGAWLVAVAGQGASVGAALLGLMTLTGLALALLRDDLVVGNGEAVEVRGLPGLLRRKRHDLASFDAIVVEEDAVEDYEEGSVRPVRRAWFSVSLEGKGGLVRTLSIDADETEDGRARGRRRAEARARRLSEQIGLPYRSGKA